MYEHRSQKLLSRAEFTTRIVRHFLFGAAVVALALFIGVAGYHYLGGLPWIDALLNASMILGGMGEVDPLRSSGAKLFASAYALCSGVFFIAMFGFVLAPFAHRLMHRFHVGEAEEKAGS